MWKKIEKLTLALMLPLVISGVAWVSDETVPAWGFALALIVGWEALEKR